jgi:hypothetical protein
MAKTPQRQQREQGRPAPRADHAGRPGGGHDRLHEAGHAGKAQPSQPAHHRVVPDGDRHTQAAPGRAEGDLGERDKCHGGSRPPGAGGLDAARQGWRLAGGAPPPSRPPDLKRVRACRAQAAQGHLARGGTPCVHPATRQPASPYPVRSLADIPAPTTSVCATGCKRVNAAVRPLVSPPAVVRWRWRLRAVRRPGAGWSRRWWRAGRCRRPTAPAWSRLPGRPPRPRTRHP